MREILFRGKRIDNGEWVEGYLVPITVDCYDKGYEIIDKDGIEYDELDYYNPLFSSERVIPETVGQYTGLTDKNGNKIFEGDIVSISGDFKGIYTCVWEEYHFDYELENKTMRCCLACVYSDDIKVIGNIHDNPELLGGDNNG